MSAVVQHKSGVTSSSPLAVAFNSPVTKGNLIVAVIKGAPFASAPTDNAGNTYTQAVTIGNQMVIYVATANATGNLTVTDPSVGETMHMHIYEVTGFAALDQSGSFAGSVGGSAASISTSGPTTTATELVVALFQSTNAGSFSWTPQAGVDASESTTDSGNNIFFSEVFEVASAGVQTATATYSSVILTLTAAIATFTPAPPQPSTFGGAPEWVYAPQAAMPRSGGVNRTRSTAAPAPAHKTTPGVVPPWLGGQRKR